MSTNFFAKQVADAYDIGIDFTDKLATGRSVTSAVVTAIDLHDNSNATSTVLETAGATVASNIVSKGVKAGTQGHTYKLVCKATLDNADVLEEEVFMLVED